jgi:uncharacterized membrane protein (UPF0127 family)
MCKRILIRLGLFVIIVFAVSIVSIIIAQRSSPGEDTLSEEQFTIMQIRNAVFKLEIADTPQAQAQGLSGRARLPEDRGMLFDFSEKGTYTFWMKDMRFPLDLIWLSDGTVVGVTQNAPPGGPQPVLTYGPPEPVDMVLEINAGLVAKYGIAKGDEVILSP